jgi:hypothetical protein
MAEIKIRSGFVPVESKRQRHRSDARETPQRTTGRVRLGGLLWTFLLVSVPLGIGLAVNSGLGWWPGLWAFLLAAVVMGTLAHRSGRRHHRR